MTASNHVLTGMVIGSAISNPLIAIPVAFLSHFAIDALPHFAIKNQKDSTFLYYLSIDSGIAAGLILSVFLLQPSNWLLVIASGIACASPDLMWMPDWLRTISEKKQKKPGLIKKFHAKVQWAERYDRIGLVIEVIWFGFMMMILIRSLYQ